MPDPLDSLKAALEGRYAIERTLGDGGMATVCLATDSKHRRRVAIKVLKPELTASLGPDRFLREVRLTAGLDHPHIVSGFGYGSPRYDITRDARRFLLVRRGEPAPAALDFIVVLNWFTELRQRLPGEP